MNPLEILYIKYTENTKASYKYRHSITELYKNTEIHTLLGELIDSLCENEEKAFYAGFYTAVKLLTGASQD